jgi:putative NADH-flavin reductase
MNIALYGATGAIGQRVLHEALQRGHRVTAVARNVSKLTEQNPQLTTVAGNVRDAQNIAALVGGHDAVISAVGPPMGGAGEEDTLFVEAAHALIAGLKQAGVKRLLVVGGAGSLEVAPGVRIVDTPDFPAAWKSSALGQADALEVYRTEGRDLDWTYFSPAAMITPGERTGKYRLGGEQLVVDEAGQSRISMEDYAVALLDEVENPQHVRRRFTVAY